MFKKLLFFAVILFAAFTAFSQQFEVSVTNINVWVKVVDKSGNPVTGLTADDFQIYEDDQLMPSTCFEESNQEQRLVAQTQTMPEVHETLSVAAQAPTRKFVLFLDLYNTSPSEYMLIKPKMQEFLDQIKDRKYQVMVAALLPTGKLGVIAPFTTNLDAIRELLDRAPSNPKRDQDLRTNLREIEQIFANMDSRTIDGQLSNAYRQAEKYARTDKDVSQFSIEALESFAGYLQKMKPGEHAIVLYVSGGFTADPGRIYYNLIDKFAESQGQNLNSVSFAMRFPSSVRQTLFDIRTQAQKSIGRLNRYNVTVYAVNTRGMYIPGGEIGTFDKQFLVQDSSILQDYQESLDVIAKETGGLSFRNSQNFKKGFDQILEDLEHQYLMCFNAPEHKTKGEYHKIKVVCKRQGVTLRYRQGYVD